MCDLRKLKGYNSFELVTDLHCSACACVTIFAILLKFSAKSFKLALFQTQGGVNGGSCAGGFGVCCYFEVPLEYSLSPQLVNLIQSYSCFNSY